MGMAAPGRRAKHEKEHLYFMSKQDEAGLILKLYELRREEKMRKARNWYFQEFNPQTIADVQNAMYGENSAYLRMVTSYWDMAAALVNNGAISMELFNDSNGEHIGVFAKVEPLLDEIRATFGGRFFASMEKLVDATPDGRKRTAASREQMKAIRAQFEARMAKSAKG